MSPDPSDPAPGNGLAPGEVPATVEFAVTYDYRCPFARIAHHQVLDALTTGPGWTVRFLPFSLGQAHVDPGGTDVWDEPTRDRGLLALQVSVAVRDGQPDRFRAVHRDLFDLRHVEGRHLVEANLVEVLRRHDVDHRRVLDEIATGAPLATVRADHEAAVGGSGAWGVPTFVVGERAAFVRLTEPADDPPAARRAIERIVGTIGGWPELNELKHTTIDR